MSIDARRRIHLTETPKLASIIDRNMIPGEPRTATVARLLERADALAKNSDDFLVFHPNRGSITTEEVARILEDEDNERISGA